MSDEHPQIAASSDRVERRARLVRAVVFAGLVFWMAAGPFYYQVLGRRGGIAHYVRPWVMFSLRGIKFVEARFLQKMPDGTLKELNRFALLGYPDRAKAPLGLRRIPNQDRTLHIAKKLCASLGPGADVRIVSRFATTRGWRRQYRGTERICR